MKGRLLKITQLGEPVLRKKSIPLRRGFGGQEVQQLILDMIVTMRKARGVGIAAPQVGVGKRIFIVAPEPSVRYPHAPTIAPIAMINPRLLKHSPSKELGYEGCLSIPGIRGEVPRYRWVEISFQDGAGHTRQARLTGFVARIFQHEFDHINGMVYMDRVEDSRTFATEREYHKRFV